MQKIVAYIKGAGPEAEAGAVLRELFKNIKQPTPSPSPSLNTRSTPAPTGTATRPSYPTHMMVMVIVFKIFVNIM